MRDFDDLLGDMAVGLALALGAVLLVRVLLPVGGGGGGGLRPRRRAPEGPVVVFRDGTRVPGVLVPPAVA